MKNNYYKLSAIACAILFFSFKVQAQYNLGIATGNWSGTNSLYLNPANIADSREKFSIDIFCLNVGVDNSLGSLNNKGGLVGAISNGSTNNIFDYSSNNQFSLLAPYGKISGPGGMVTIHKKHTVALTTAIRGMNQFNNFDKSLYQTISDPSYVASGNLDITSKNFNYTAHIWSEVGLSYGGVLLDRGHNELKVGVTLRYLGGIAYVGLKGDNLSAKFNAGSDSFFAATNSDIEYSSNVLSTTNAVTNGFTKNSLFDQFFGGKSGSGIGGDIGIVYDYIDEPERERYDMDGRVGLLDYSKNRYKFRLSASIVDFGSILYKSDNNSNAEVKGNGYLTGTGLINNVKDYNDFTNYVQAQGFTADTIHRNTRVYMPTRMIFGADYHIYKKYYVNATFIANVANRQNFGNSYYNQITVTPRYDTRFLSVGVPLTYGMLSKSFKAGVGVRVSGFFFGSDDLLALFANHQYGFNFYVGGFVPFYKFKPKDSDGDHVSNRRDKCPTEMGTWENRGCPTDDKGKDKDDKDADDKTEN